MEGKKRKGKGDKYRKGSGAEGDTMGGCRDREAWVVLRVAVATTPSSIDPNSLSTMNQGFFILKKVCNNFP